MCNSRFIRKRHGLAAVELAIIIPVVLLFLFGILEFGRLVNVHMILRNAAREGASQASLGEKSESEIEQVVLQYLRQAEIPADRATVAVRNEKTSSADPRHARKSEPIRVTVTIPLSDVQWLNLTYFFQSGSTITNSCVWLCRKDGASVLIQ